MFTTYFAESVSYPIAKSHEIHPPATMILDGETETHLRTLHLNGALLELGPEEEAFFRAEIGIQDTEELRKHIIEVHEEAYKVGTCLLECSMIECNPAVTL